MSNKCNCPSPPGGSVECGDDQLAICQIKNGQIVARCISPGRFTTSPQAQLKWAIKILSEYSRSEIGYLGRTEQLEILKKGRIKTRGPRGNIIELSFTLTKVLNRYLDISDQSSNTLEGFI